MQQSVINFQLFLSVLFSLLCFFRFSLRFSLLTSEDGLYALLCKVQQLIFLF